MPRSLGRDELERVLLQRLVYDGYNTGEDRRLINIYKNAIKFCVDPKVDHNELSATINQDITAALKAAEKHAKELKYYEEKSEQVRKDIQQKEFETKLIKISSLPDCAVTNKTIHATEERKKHLMIQLEKRGKIIKDLFQKCQSLATIINEDDDDDQENLGNKMNVE